MVEDKKMIPLSVIDALIAECQFNYEQLKDNPDVIIKVEARMFELFIQRLRGLEKKEAVVVPDQMEHLPECTCNCEELKGELIPVSGLEQKIKDRINEIFPKASEYDDVLVFTESDSWLMVLEELRKLLK